MTKTVLFISLSLVFLGTAFSADAKHLEYFLAQQQQNQTTKKTSGVSSLPDVF